MLTRLLLLQEHIYIDELLIAILLVDFASLPVFVISRLPPEPIKKPAFVALAAFRDFVSAKITFLHNHR